MPIANFLFGLEWSPQTAIRADQVAASGSFGAVPLLTGTLLITVIAMAVAGPIGLLSAIYLAEYAPPQFRAAAKPIMEILAGVPTVVYGFFAALTVAPFMRDLGRGDRARGGLGKRARRRRGDGDHDHPVRLVVVRRCAAVRAAVVARGVLGLGATTSETITKVIVPAALPGIIAGFLLAVSRAIGETMIVVMAAGLAANLTANPLEAVTTVTVQIVTLLTGDRSSTAPRRCRHSRSAWCCSS